VRFRLALALMVAGLLCAAGVASAQDTSTEPLSGYTNTTPTPKKTPTTENKPSTAGQEESSVAPTVAAQPAGEAPSNLAFTGGEPLLLIAFGLAIAGGTATFLVRDRRRSQQ
jgi:hypothetical protein